MSNRAQRRASVADFKRRVSGRHLLTYLIDGDDEASLDRHTVLRDAAAFWQANRASRKPCCIACKLSLASDEAVGAFLFATSPGSPGIASVSALCSTCSHLPLDQIEHHGRGFCRIGFPVAASRTHDEDDDPHARTAAVAADCKFAGNSDPLRGIIASNSDPF